MLPPLPPHHYHYTAMTLHSHMTIDWTAPWNVGYWHPDYAEEARQVLHASGRWDDLQVRQLIPTRQRWYLVPARGIQSVGW